MNTNNITEFKSCCIYIRVSTDEQAKEGYSLANQQGRCNDEAKYRGYSVKGTFIEDGKTGRNTKRPEFQRMMAFIEENHVDAVIIYKIDRFARNVRDFAKVYDELKQKDIKFLSVIEGDLTNGNSLIPNIFASVAQWESEVNGQRTSDALMQKFKEGQWPGWAPLGYINIRDHNGKGDIEVDPDKGHLITLLFDLYSTGEYTIDRLVELMYTKGLRSKSGKRVYRSIMYNIVHNTFYIGEMHFKNEINFGSYKPLTSREVFKACQRVSQINNQNACRKRKYKWLVNGKAFCATCGSRLYPEFQNKKQHAYYHCNTRVHCSEPYFEMKDFYRKIELEIRKVQIPKPFALRVMKKAKELLEKSNGTLESERQAINNALNQLEIKRSRLEDVYLEKDIDKETYRRKHDELEGQIRMLNERMFEAEINSKIDTETLDKVLNMASNIYSTYMKSNFEAKRLYLSIFFERLETKGREIVNVKLTPLFEALLASNYRVTPNLLAKWDDFRTTNWPETEFPDLTLRQTQELLAS